jgi:glycosyltransferase involved in cell wall biosynthesis/acetyltransferase-like isoleucine patch superfamily enzyme
MSPIEHSSSASTPLPRISVVLPNYNHCHYLKTSLPALLAQSYPALEIIVVDDASTDDSVAYIEAMRREHPTIRLLRHAKNQGVNAALNHGISAISGEAVYLAAADDEVYPGFFAEAARQLAAHPEAGFFCSDGDIYHLQDHVLETRHLGLADQATYLSPETLLRRLRQLQLFCFESHTIISRRQTFAEQGGLDPQLGYRADWFFNWVNAARHGCCYSPLVFGKFLDRSDSYSQSTARYPRADRVIWRKIMAKIRAPDFQDLRPFILIPAHYTGHEGMIRRILVVLIQDPANWKLIRPRLVFAWVKLRSRRNLGFWRRNLSPRRLWQDVEKICRPVVWPICWFACAQISRLVPARKNSLLIFTMRFFGAKIAPHCTIDSTAWIPRPWRLQLGNNVRIGARVKILSLGRVTLGDATIVHENVQFPKAHPSVTVPPGSPPAIITIGAHCELGAGARIFPGCTVPSNTSVPEGSVISNAGTAA